MPKVAPGTAIGVGSSSVAAAPTGARVAAPEGGDSGQGTTEGRSTRALLFTEGPVGGVAWRRERSRLAGVRRRPVLGRAGTVRRPVAPAHPLLPRRSGPHFRSRSGFGEPGEAQSRHDQPPAVHFRQPVA